MENKISNRVRTRERIFTYERELKMQLRKVLDRVEQGLIAIDNGREREVHTGKIDITAQDKNGHYVVIELKVGPCPTGAMEQVLGYAADLEEETGLPCRAMIVASSFPPRIKAAATRTIGLRLVPYVVGEIDFGESIPPYQ